MKFFSLVKDYKSIILLKLECKMHQKPLEINSRTSNNKKNTSCLYYLNNVGSLQNVLYVFPKFLKNEYCRTLKKDMMGSPKENNSKNQQISNWYSLVDRPNSETYVIIRPGLASLCNQGSTLF